MQLPTIFEWLAHFSFLRGMPAVYSVLALTLIIFFVPDWRVSLLALIVYYLVAGLLFADVLEPRLAFVKVVVGLFVCLILYVTGRQVRWPAAETAVEAGDRQRRLVAFLLRLFAAAMLLLFAFYVGQRPLLPHLAALPAHLPFAVIILIGVGLLTALLTAVPLRAGMGVLLMLSGFELLYNGVTAALPLLLALAAINLAVALAVSFLAQVRHGLIPLSQ